MTRLSPVSVLEAHLEPDRRRYRAEPVRGALARRARDTPDALAFRFLGEAAEQPLSYGDLDRRAHALAGRIRAFAREGDRVLLLLPPGLDFIPAIFACFEARVIAVPVDLPRKRHRFGRIEAIVRDCEPTLLLSTAAHLEELARQPNLGRPLAGLTRLAVDEPAEAPRPCGLDAESIDPESLAFLQYTSGSTAAPKGVMIRHRNLMATLTDLDRGWGPEDAASFATWLPVFHDMGLIYGILLPVFVGAPCTALSPTAFLQQPLRWLEAISRFRVVNSAAPTFAYELCARRIREEQARALDLSCWRVALVGAEPIHAGVLERFARALEPAGFDPTALYCGYGLAEASLKATTVFAGEGRRLLEVDSSKLAAGVVEPAAEPAPGETQTAVSCGRSHHGSRIAIVDPDSGVELGPGRVGEVWMGGEGIAAGYWNRPDATRDTFGACLAGGEGPLLRTGDLGFLHDGDLFLCGRIKDLIIVRGQNYYPQDLEAISSSAHPRIAGGLCAAFSIDDERGPRVVIVQEAPRTALRDLCVDEVVAAIRAAVWDAHGLELYAVALVKPATIPRTSSGKIQRFECRRRFTAGELALVGERRLPTPALDSPAPDAARAPRNGSPIDDLEGWTRGWIACRLQIAESSIDLETSFADLGVDSVAAVELAEALRQELGERAVVSDTVLWEFSTVRELAAGVLAPPRNGRSASRNGHNGVVANAVERDLNALSEERLRELLSAELDDVEPSQGGGR